MTETGGEIARADAADETLRRENAFLRVQVARLQRELATAGKLVEQVRHLSFWDFTPYAIVPDDSWLAVDRTQAVALMSALAHVDHWHPWSTPIEPRPQP